MVRIKSVLLSFGSNETKVEGLTKDMEEKVANHFHSKDQLKESLHFMAQFYPSGQYRCPL